MEHVRPAGAADLRRCAELLAAARAEAAASRGGDLLLALDDGAATVEGWAAEGPSRLLLVGTFDEVTIGLATGHVRPRSFGDGRRLGRVDCCYVEPGARRVGVGGAMVERLVGWLTEQGCTDLDTVALPGDRDTKQLYETAGFRARLLVLHRSLR